MSDGQKMHNDDGIESLISVSMSSLLLTSLPVIALAFISHYMGLELESPIIVGGIRTFVQLGILGFVLKPIFTYGVRYWWLVILYVLFITVLAAYESSKRSKYYIDYMFLYILCAYLINIAVISVYTFGFIIPSKPLWDPHYVIPIIGMLLGNCINGVSLAMNTFLTGLVEQTQEIETYLAFGASINEATERLVRDSVRVSAMPLLNTMAVIGIISIPGMMTGQILGGSPPMEAARYQIFIIYLIAICTFGMILAETEIVRLAVFDNRGVLRTEAIKIRSTNANFLGQVKNVIKWRSSKDKYSSLLFDDKDAEAVESRKLNSYASIAPNLVQLSCIQRGENDVNAANELLEGRSLSKSVRVTNNEDETTRPIITDLDFSLQQGELLSVTGPSGAGKSVLLRMIGGLGSADAGNLLLNGQDLQHTDATHWRRQVRYVQQSRLSIPGTPLDFMQRVARLSSWKTSDSLTYRELARATSSILDEWKMNSDAVLKSEWTSLSGGEAQRVYLAVCLASRPKVLLMDESTSALDQQSKEMVEATVKKMTRVDGVGIMMVSHDSDQIGRMGME